MKFICLQKKIALKRQKKNLVADVEPIKLIALQERNKHNRPLLATGIIKAFYLCKVLGGEFRENDETCDCRYFSLNNLPKLSLGRNTKEQIEMCYRAAHDRNWQTVFE
ncbi:hypothetical protein HMPREF0493_1156 [Lactobacillus amylolyticus DSM 11664]|uniref:Uncharacterized protein n=1 Tax=Lactobacillus amylolyticus DSM 11664 TaxID=585524 RepID=D4YUE5_9LACO|nr:hypothetical protein HMPREF0493_1156 [Lactobacillus amylolyticus DSM 11664]